LCELFGVILVFGRLRAHQAIAIAALRDEDRVVGGIWSVKRPNEARPWLQHHDIAIAEMVAFSHGMYNRQRQRDERSKPTRVIHAVLI
jgi:hypothetical protein